MIRVIVRHGACEPQDVGLFAPEHIDPFVELLRRHDFYGDNGGDAATPIDVTTQFVATDGRCAFEVYVDIGGEE